MANKQWTFMKKSCAMFFAATLMVTGVGTVPAAAEVREAAQADAGATMRICGVADNCMQEIFTNLTKAGSEYVKMKSVYKDPETGAQSVNFTENCDGNKITITTEVTDKKSDIYEDFKEIEGSWEFVLDGDYLVFTYPQEKYFGLSLFSVMGSAVYEYLGVDADLADGLVYATDSGKVKTDYFINESDAASGKDTVKLYVAEKWNLETALNGVYPDEATLKSYGVGTLGDNSQNFLCGIGKLRVYIFGDKKSVDIAVAEYGGRSELTYKSMIALAKVLKPVGYETFVKKYTKLQTASTNGYKVAFPSNKADLPEAFQEFNDKFQFTTIHFSAPVSIKQGSSISLKAGKTKKLTIVNDSAVSWTSSNKKAAVVNQNGKVTALKKGTAIITAKLSDGRKLTCKVKVKSSPTIKVGGKAFKKSKTYTVQATKTLEVKISGKAATVKNAYSTTKKKVAKVTSKKTASKVKIKGLAKGTATIGIKVNGVKFSIKVKVK